MIDRMVYSYLKEAYMEEQDTDNPTVENEVHTENSGETQGFTQEEVDRIIKDRLARERQKILKKYEDVDVDKYRELLTAEEQKIQEEQAKRGEFEKILQTTVEKKDTVISQLQQELHAVKVDGSILNAASASRAVNPQQVVRLLKENVKLNDAGQVDVLDENGAVRYNDDGTPMTVDQFVGQWLKENPHFVNATPSGSGSQGNIAGNSQLGGVDVNNLDMNNPKHREIYKEHMKAKGIRI